MARGGLISSGQLLGYDGTKTYTKRYFGIADGPVLHVTASIASGAGATVFGMPCDYLFTQYASAVQRGIKYKNILECAATLLREEGPLAFYRGSTAFFVRTVPIFTLYFPIYEQVRLRLGMGYMD